MTAVNGHWKIESSDEYWDDYMKACGLGMVLRQVGRRITSYEHIYQDGDTWCIDITSTFKNQHLKFKLGEEFDETTLDGRHVKSTFEVVDNKLVHNQKVLTAGIPDSTITRARLDDNTMAITLETIGTNSVKTTRKFSRQANK